MNKIDTLVLKISQNLAWLATWMGGEFGEEQIHVYVWLSPFAVHLKPSHLSRLMKVKSESVNYSVMSDSFQPHGL